MRSPFVILPFAIVAAARNSGRATPSYPRATFVDVQHRSTLLHPPPSPPLTTTTRTTTTRTSTRKTKTTTGSRSTTIDFIVRPSPSSPLSLRASTKGGGSDETVKISFPTPEDANAMGIRDWPQRYKTSSWTEEVDTGMIATRYVLDGRGRVTIDYYDDDDVPKRIANRRVYPGTLVEVDGEAKLSWDVDDERTGMIVLTPNYEEGGKLLLVMGFLVVFCAGLLFGSSGI